MSACINSGASSYNIQTIWSLVPFHLILKRCIHPPSVLVLWGVRRTLLEVSLALKEMRSFALSLVVRKAASIKSACGRFVQPTAI